MEIAVMTGILGNYFANLYAAMKMVGEHPQSIVDTATVLAVLHKGEDY
jgi:hypothetical protein